IYFFFFQAEDGIRDRNVTGVQTCALPISNNCAVCHTATYRLREDEVPHVVVAGPAHTNNVQSMLRFLFKAAHDPRFNSDIIMNEIRLVSANNYGNGGLSFIDRQIYHYLLIPFTKKALLQQEKQFTWME